MIGSPIARLFWDMDVGAIDPAQHRRLIIARVLNYGTLRDWRWLAEQYGKEVVRAEADAPGRNSVRERSRQLAALLFS